MSNIQKRILAASLTGLIIVGGAFYVKQSRHSEIQVQTIIANSGTGNLARKHIPVTDSDSDGIPDWQVGFAVGEPIYLDATNTEPYLPPDTLTGEFSVPYFESVLALDNLGMLDQTKDQLIDIHVSELEEKTQEKVYTKDDLKNVIDTTDKEALRAYGNLLAVQVYAYQAEGEDEFTIFTKLTEDGNPKHLEKLTLIEKQYDKLIVALLELEVPERYVFEHLAILNSFSALQENVKGLQLYFDDPVHMLIRWRRMGEDVLRMRNNIIRLHDGLYLDDEVEFLPDDVLPELVDALQNV